MTTLVPPVTGPVPGTTALTLGAGPAACAANGRPIAGGRAIVSAPSRLTQVRRSSTPAPVGSIPLLPAPTAASRGRNRANPSSRLYADRRRSQDDPVVCIRCTDLAIPTDDVDDHIGGTGRVEEIDLAV